MGKIKVGMDISQLAHTGGVVTYTHNLSQYLSRLPELDMVFFYSSLRKKYKGNLKNVKNYRLPPSIFEVLFNRLRNIPIEKFIGPVDIFHSSDWAQPPSKAIKITTYHDVVPIKYPEWSHPSIVNVHKKRLELVCKEVDHIIAVSETTKKDLIEVSGIPSEKITVVYEGPTADFKQKSEKEKDNFRRKYNLPEEFVLAIGGVGERRNLKRIKEACKDLSLVVSGQTFPWLENDELELLYNCASVLAYCSLYEGFGIPIVDAFSCDLPVVTSNVSAMSEIAGNAAILVDPLDVEDMKKNLKRLMEDKKLREELKIRGKKRAQEFSWEKTAIQTADIYAKLLNR